ncbi:uncharacterized protein LOC134856736 isoform X2 [Symsagittifera roscoffensis]|uniref:uncharacterized protein LOC134856736 isoform X2 n=1 Tax=Symsagittifera roscoffensis TaxID=84072 RepID=UPI00307BED88
MTTNSSVFVLLGFLLAQMMPGCVGYTSTRSICDDSSESPTTEEISIATVTASVPESSTESILPVTIMTESPDRRVAISINEIATTFVNLTIADEAGSATVYEIEAECHSDVFQACDTVTFRDNLFPSARGFLEASGLLSGAAYDITIVSATHGGNADTSLDATVRFCTQPRANFAVRKLSETSIEIDTGVESGYFQSATVTFFPSCSVTFTPLMLPLQSRMLASTCGAGGSQSSDQQGFEYNPNVASKILPGSVVLMVTVLWTMAQ